MIILLGLMLMILWVRYSPVAAAPSDSEPGRFTDISPDNADYPYIQFLYSQGLVSGFDDGTIREAQSITRAEAACLLAQATHAAVEQPAASSFSDVPAQNWALPYIEAVAKEGKMIGYDDHTFKPEALLTRTELTALLMNISDAAGAPVDLPAGISDVGPDHWGYSFIAQGLDAGIMKEASTHQFAPDAYGTRGQVFRGLAIALTLDPHKGKTSLVAQVKVKRGSAQIIKNGLEKPIHAPTACSTGDTILVGPRSQAEILFPDGSSFLLLENTKLTITAATGQIYIQHTGEPGILVDELKLKLDQGQIFGVLSYSYFIKDAPDSPARAAAPSMRQTARGLEDPQQSDLPWWKVNFSQKERLEVDMPWSVAGVRGTIFSLKVTKTENSAAVVDGTVELTAGGATVPLANPLNYTSVSGPGRQPLPPQAMPPSWLQQWQSVLAWIQEALERITQAAPCPGSAPVFNTPGHNLQQNMVAAVMQTVQAALAGAAASPSQVSGDGGGGGGGGGNSTYSISYNGNGSTGGSVPVDPNLYASGAAVTVPGNSGGLVNPGLTFGGWNTAANGSGTTYKAGHTLVMGSSDITLYALWMTDSDVVLFTDPILESAVRNALGIPVGNITVGDMKTLTVLPAGPGIMYLDGIEFAANLQQLILFNNDISDVSLLAGLSNLQSLNLGANDISNIAPLASLNHLATLILHYNMISDVSPLAGLTNLQSLDIYENNISDISPLAGLTNLQELGLGSNNFSDLSILAGLTNLAALNLYGLNISESDLTVLFSLPNLQKLELGNNSISDPSVLGGLTNLQSLSLVDINIAAPAWLATLTGLQELTLMNNNISDISALAGLINLRQLNLSLNNPSDILALSGLSNLEDLRLSQTNTSNILILGFLTNLHVLALEQNNISDISPLGSLANLEVLTLGDNRISDISSLSGLGHLTEVNISNNFLDLTPGSAAMTVINGLIAGSVDVSYLPQRTAYSLSYDGNGSTGGSVPAVAKLYAEGETVTVLGNSGGLVKPGFAFAGWNTAADGSGSPYVESDTFAMGAANVTLYAMWI
jgi:uncharacterized repeat protein (TIGR02543 family)